MDYSYEVKKLVIAMVENGYKPEEISWLFTSTVTKECDVYYRLDKSLTSKPNDEPCDNPAGDSETSTMTHSELDKQLEQYNNHDIDCKCFSRDDLCPICLEDACEYKLNCCNSYMHELCINKSFQSRKKCPLCRGKLMLDITGDIPKVVKKVIQIPKIVYEPPPQPVIMYEPIDNQNWHNDSELMQKNRMRMERETRRVDINVSRIAARERNAERNKKRMESAAREYSTRVIPYTPNIPDIQGQVDYSSDPIMITDDCIIPSFDSGSTLPSLDIPPIPSSIPVSNRLSLLRKIATPK